MRTRRSFGHLLGQFRTSVEWREMKLAPLRRDVSDAARRAREMEAAASATADASSTKNTQ